MKSNLQINSIPDRKEIDQVILKVFLENISSFLEENKTFTQSVSIVAKICYAELGFKKMKITAFKNRFFEGNTTKYLKELYDRFSKRN